MANIQKYKDNGIRDLIDHIGRRHKNYSNVNVDISRSDSNIYYVNNTYEYYKNRIENDLYVYAGWNDKTKAKYNSLCSICIHCPEECENEKLFFDTMHQYFEKKFGKENIICSVVHNDETSPHLHFTFIPCIFNEKKNRYQLSYEKCIAHEFDNFHNDINDYLKKIEGLENIKVTKDEDKKIDNFYLKNIKSYGELQKSLKELTEQVENYENQISMRENKINELNRKGIAMVEKYNTLIDKYNVIKKEFDNMQNEMKKYLNDELDLDEKINFHKKYNFNEIR